MALNFEKLPSNKPAGNNAVAEGTYSAVVFKSEMRTSKNTNSEYLNVSFKLDEGGFVNENYFESDKPFLLYKLGRLLDACGAKLEGEGTLKDVQKVIAGKKVIVDVALNDNGYPTLDYSDKHEGVYPFKSESLDDEIGEAIEANLDSDEF